MFKHIIEEGLTLELVTPYDCEAFYKVIDSNRKHLREWLPWVDGTASAKDTEDFIKHSMRQYAATGEFQALIKVNGEIAGIIGLHELSHYSKRTSIGYWLAEGYQGKGIMTKACKAVIDYAFTTMKLRRVEIRCADENFKSQAIPKRLGFKEEGVCRKSENLYGNFVDLIVFSMLVEEWQ